MISVFENEATTLCLKIKVILLILTLLRVEGPFRNEQILKFDKTVQLTMLLNYNVFSIEKFRGS